ncbi:DNA polymerase III [Arthrobacter sp. Hiyo8]|nr:DNA polymerase III [Arthrobacter sp. Hiyo8]
MVLVAIVPAVAPALLPALLLEVSVLDSHGHFIIGYRQFMELTLELLRDRIDTVEVTVRRGPPGEGQVNAPAAFADPQILRVGAVQRRSLVQVVVQRFRLKAWGRLAAGTQYAPPSHGASVVAHDRSDLPGTARAQKLGNIPIGHGNAGRHEIHDGQHRRHKLHPHAPSLSAWAAGSAQKECRSGSCRRAPVALKHELLEYPPRAAFDLETTGRNSRSARIVTASITVVDDDGGVIKELEWLADPGIEIPLEASEIHGITTEKARAEGRPAAEVTREVAAALQELFDDGVPVIAFNASYDFTVLAAESARYGVPQLSRFPVLDPTS